MRVDEDAAVADDVCRLCECGVSAQAHRAEHQVGSDQVIGGIKAFAVMRIRRRGRQPRPQAAAMPLERLYAAAKDKPHAQRAQRVMQGM